MSCTLSVGTADSQGSREDQQDSHVVTDPAGSGAPFSSLRQVLVVLADGMGGAAGGRRASETVVHAFAESIRSQPPEANAPERLRGALEEAHHALRRAVVEEGSPEGMGCTVVGALVDCQNLYWVSVGDSHLYLLRGSSLAKLNADHSYGAELDRMAAEGAIPMAEAGNHPDRNALLSALTIDPLEEVDVSREPMQLQPGDRLLFSSDGLDTLRAEQLRELSNRLPEAQDYARGLIDAVEGAAKPRQDNTMVVVVDLQPAAVDERPESGRSRAASAPQAQAPTKSTNRWLTIGLLVLITALVLLLILVKPDSNRAEEESDTTGAPPPTTRNLLPAIVAPGGAERVNGKRQTRT